MELKLRRPLQWLICLLHANELPLRHLMQKLDGGTQGPDVFSGIIGKALKTCEQLPVVQYSAIMLENCPSLDGTDLCTDQQYMYRHVPCYIKRKMFPRSRSTEARPNRTFPLVNNGQQTAAVVCGH